MGRGLAVGPDRGDGVGRGVVVAVAVAVGLAVGVALASPLLLRWASRWRWGSPWDWESESAFRRHRGKNINPAPAIYVVWRPRRAALGGRDKDSRVI